MRLTFLGTGTSAGIPAIGCDCPVCTSTDPRDNRLRTSAALEFTDPSGMPRTILFDAGPDLRQQALRFGIKRCDGVLMTHNHVDHAWGLDELRRFNAVQQEAIPVYADEHTMENLRRVYLHIFERHRNVNDSFVAALIPWTITGRDVEEGRGVELHGVRATPLRLLHGKLPILGWRLDATPALAEAARDVLPLAYCTDVSGIPPESWGMLRGLKTLVLDALRHRRHPTHFTLGEAVSVAERVGAGRTHFVHMAHDLGHEETQAGLPEGMELAWDGKRVGGW
jgi:phosphoribosyl 1,2-cyclic phosphate phosphodiesterase